MADMARPARLARLRELLSQECHTSQQELAAALATDDIQVSQSTLSKDLVAVGAIRRRITDGALVYALGNDGDVTGLAMEKLARHAAELVLSIQSTGNQVVLRTPPGAAQFFAAGLDTARLPGVMGTLAGDDTVLVITHDEDRASQVIAAISEMARTGKPQTDTHSQEDEQ